MRLIAKMPTIAAMAYKYHIGQPFVYPKNELNFAANFLHMCFAVPCEEYKVNPVLARAMDRIFILHADHEQNASTSTVRLAGSSGANPFACIAAGIACLWGPAHGGANEAALNMLGEIGTVDRIPEFIARAKDKNDPFRLMGFGHRVYKNYDPRAKIMQKTTHEVLGELGIKDDPMLDVAMELEKIALTDEYFIEKKLYPNIDFYSGITLKALGFPTTMFTVLFAVARTVGWIAQWKEMIEDPAPEDRPAAPALHRRHRSAITCRSPSGRQRFQESGNGFPSGIAETRLRGGTFRKKVIRFRTIRNPPARSAALPGVSVHAPRRSSRHGVGRRRARTPRRDHPSLDLGEAIELQAPQRRCRGSSAARAGAPACLA